MPFGIEKSDRVHPYQSPAQFDEDRTAATAPGETSPRGNWAASRCAADLAKLVTASKGVPWRADVSVRVTRASPFMNVS